MFTTNFARLDDNGMLVSKGDWSPTVNVHLLRTDNVDVSVSHFSGDVLSDGIDWFAVTLNSGPYPDDLDNGQVSLFLNPQQMIDLRDRIDAALTANNVTT